MSVKKTQSKAKTKTKAKAKTKAEPVVPKDNQDRDAVEIGELWGKANRSLAEANEYYIECGKRLIAKKESLPHGRWLPWLKDHAAVLGFESKHTAARLIKAAKSSASATFDLADATTASRQRWGHNEPRATQRTPVAEPFNSDLETLAGTSQQKERWIVTETRRWFNDAVEAARKTFKFGHPAQERLDPDVLRAAVEDLDQLVAALRESATATTTLADAIEDARATRTAPTAPPPPMFDDAAKASNGRAA